MIIKSLTKMIKSLSLSSYIEILVGAEDEINSFCNERVLVVTSYDFLVNLTISCIKQGLA